MAETRECWLCHRIGYRSFTPFGDRAWVCANDRACAQRVAHRVESERLYAAAVGEER